MTSIWFFLAVFFVFFLYFFKQLVRACQREWLTSRLFTVVVKNVVDTPSPLSGPA